VTSDVVLSGWRPGSQKIALDKLLRERAGLTLREALDSVNHLLAGEQLSIPVASPAEAQAIAAEATELGAAAEVVEVVEGTRPRLG
jgi:ribosomal protein L7/L12